VPQPGVIQAKEHDRRLAQHRRLALETIVRLPQILTLNLTGNEKAGCED
jgi:hypothetical protein